ncbi:MAG TPA: hypothetical protein VHO27_17030 [Angustibacter sp.]|nr:hypothetical protein [Angustibacter sp.]
MRAIDRTTVRTIPTVIALTAATLLGAAACGAQDAGDAVGTSGTSPTTTTPAGSGTPSATPTPGGRMTEGISQPVVLVRTGGIGGLKDRLELRPDGTYTVTSKSRAPVTRQLSEGQLAAIVDAVQAADLPQVATQQSSTSSPTERRSDELFYVLSAQGVTVTFSETTAPDAARPLLEELGALFSSPGSTR